MKTFSEYLQLREFYQPRIGDRIKINAANGRSAVGQVAGNFKDSTEWVINVPSLSITDINSGVPTLFDPNTNEKYTFGTIKSVRPGQLVVSNLVKRV